MLRFLGIGSAFNTRLGNTSAWMETPEGVLLVDCGSAVFERLLRGRVLHPEKQVTVVITHTHGDHVGSLGDLVFYCYYILKQSVTIHHPDPGRLVQLLTLLGVPEGLYAVVGDSGFSWGPVAVRFLPQRHAEEIPAYGLLVTGPEGVFWYSGDARGLPDSVREGFLAGAIGRLYQDTCSYEVPGSLHLSLRQLSELIPAPERSRVTCMHLDEGFPYDEAKAMGFEVATIDERLL